MGLGIAFDDNKGGGGHGLVATFEVLLRFLASLMSVAGLMLLVKDQQTVVQAVGNQNYYTEVRYSYVAGLQYLVYSNGLVAIYCFTVALLSIVSAIGGARNGKLGAWVVFVFDQGLAYVLLAAASASSDVAYLADKGNDKTTWPKICSTFPHFCKLLRASIVIAFFSVLLLAIISILSARQLFKKYGRK